MRRLAHVLLLTFLCAVTLTAQQMRTITGRILDKADKQPLIGASVTVPQETGKIPVGTAADANGNFTLKVPADTKHIICRFLGYRPQTVVLNRDKEHYVIRLEDEGKELQEVVVSTGYQKIDRRKLTAAVSTFNVSDEATGAVHSIDQALAGQIAGLSSVASSGSPSAPMKLRIRGTSSINGTQDPLWILDGIPLEGTDIPSMEDLKDIDNIYQTSIAGINPSDIESITVLKDAAATAIYGARAANGVIVITTKQGKAGKPSINFSTKLTYSPRTDIDRLNLLNSQQKVGLELDLLQSGYSFRDTKGEVARILDQLGETALFKEEGWNALSADAQRAINRLRNTYTDWNDILFRSAFNQEYNVSLSGGNDKATYYTSVGYYDEKGNVEGVRNNRFNLTLKLNYQVNKKLKLGASVFANQRSQQSYLTEDLNGFTNPVYYARLVNPYMQPFNADGTYRYDVNVQGGKEDSSLDFNIFEERANTSNERTDRSFTGIFDAEFKWNKQFKLSTQFGYQLDAYKLERYAGKNSFVMRKQMERTIYSFDDGSKRSFLPDGGMNKVTNADSYQWTWKALAEYQNTFREIHDVEVMLGTEVRSTESASVYTASYGYDKKTLTSTPVIFPNERLARSWPLYIETLNESAFVSWFGTASYTFMHRYTLGGSIRFDGSDIFGVAKKYRYLPLYSVSGLWRISQEPFMRNLNFLNNLNLRASYGLQGNIDKQTSPYLIGTYDKETILPGNTEESIVVSNAPNPRLRWEKTQSVNAGIDFVAFDNALTINLDYYYRKGSDLIGLRMLPLENGFSATTINWASMENRGFEIAISTRNIHTRNFTWFTSLNMGYNENKILQETVAENATYPGREGRPVGAIFALKTAGLDSDGYPLFVNKKGEKVTATELLKLNNYGASTLSAKEQRDLYTYMGSTDPKVSGGFMNTFKYKSLTLGINCIFNFGMHVRCQPSYSPTYYDRGLNTNTDILNRWTPEHTNTIFPKLMTSDERPAEYIQYNEYNLYSMLDIWVKKSNYFRIQSLRLAYDLPARWLKPIGVRNASVSLEGRNLWVIASNYNNFLDPETVGNPYAQPIPKSFIFGLNVNF